MVGYGPFSVCLIHKEGLCPSSGDINRLTMMMTEKNIESKKIRTELVLLNLAVHNLRKQNAIGQFSNCESWKRTNFGREMNRAMCTRKQGPH
jgi:hypothetical protein